MSDPTRDLRAAANGSLAWLLSERYLDEHCVLPLEIDSDGAITTAVGGPLDPSVIDHMSRVFGRPLRFVELPAGEIQAAILSARRDVRPPGIDPVDEDRTQEGMEEPLDDLFALASQAPVVKVVNVMLIDALRAEASDVHVESTASGLRVRFRLDGVLQEVSNLADRHRSAVINRLKIMAGLDIAERRLPQDGRARLRLAEREIDLRVSTLPAIHGENVALRILDHGTTARELPDLGMPDDVSERFERLISRSSGILLVTGPTGSGKTTTLYGALTGVNRPGVKIVTVEDPVEYQIEAVTQVPVNRRSGLSFATALRSILRHDPDVIMIGEMRDRETAEIAIQAALTGHLVFSTLHTNDAAGGITRLVDMGIEPYLVAATVQGILAQRLVRKVCKECKDTGSSAGCSDCLYTGYKGRSGIFELLTITEEMRSLIVGRSSLDDIRRTAHGQGMRSLYEDGMRKVAEGVTTIEEVLRVTGEDSGF